MNVLKSKHLDRDEIFYVLENAKYGRLAVAENNQPYAIPVFYQCMFDDDRVLFLISSRDIGEKMRCMRMNPKVALEVELAGEASICTVLANGRVTRFLNAEETPESDGGYVTVEIFAQSVSGRKYERNTKNGGM